MFLHARLLCALINLIWFDLKLSFKIACRPNMQLCDNDNILTAITQTTNSGLKERF